MVIGDEKKRPIVFNDTDKAKRGFFYYFLLALVAVPSLALLIYLVVDMFDFGAESGLPILALGSFLELFLLGFFQFVEKSITRKVYKYDMVRLIHGVTSYVFMILSPILVGISAAIEADCMTFMGGLGVFLLVAVICAPFSWLGFMLALEFTIEEHHITDFEQKLADTFYKGMFESPKIMTDKELIEYYAKKFAEEEKKRAIDYNDTDKARRGVFYYIFLALVCLPATGLAGYLVIDNLLWDIPGAMAILSLSLIPLTFLVSLFQLVERSITKKAYKYDKVRIIHSMISYVCLFLSPVLLALAGATGLCETFIGGLVFFLFALCIAFFGSWIAFFFIIGMPYADNHVTDIEKKLADIFYKNAFNSPKHQTYSSFGSYSYTSARHSSDYDHADEMIMYRQMRSRSGSSSSRGKYIGSNGEFRINDEMRAYNEDIQMFRSINRDFDAEEHFGWEQDMSYKSDGYSDYEDF